MKDMIKNFVNPIYNNKKGFTLIELAIVMVIIGLILGAVMKGQDLIVSARAKGFTSKSRAWDTAVWSYLDRKGRLPGDGDRSGLIGDTAGDNFLTDLVGASFLNPPYTSSAAAGNNITIGGATFFVFFGNDGTYNVMTICKDVGCGTFLDDELVYAESLDVAIDGISEGSDGKFRASKTLITTSAGWQANYSATQQGIAYDTTVTHLLYYFDRAP